MRKLVLLGLIFCSTTHLFGQEIGNGAREFELFAQGGHSVSGGTGNTGVFDAGARYGFGLFRLGRGSLQYELEFIPIYVLSQPGTNAYGVNFTPFDLKYNFRRNAAHLVPFVELGGGVLFTNNDVPAGTSSVNFTPQAGIGVHLPFGAHGYHATLAFKYVHISNAGLSVPNPGINTVQFRIGIGKFKR